MINLQDALPLIIKSIILFYKEYKKTIFNDDVVIKHVDELYYDMYNRIYNECVNVFKNDSIYEIGILYEINPNHITYNKLSCDNNILETLSAYIDWLIEYNIFISYDTTIISLSCDIPFEVSVNITYGWIKSIINIYR